MILRKSSCSRVSHLIDELNKLELSIVIATIFKKKNRYASNSQNTAAYIF